MKVINFCIRYKYLLTVVVFVAYLMLGDNSIFKKMQLSREIRELNKELQQGKAIAASMKTQNNLSSITTKEEEEEYFRKYHYLKKENEDVFRIVRKNKGGK